MAEGRKNTVSAAWSFLFVKMSNEPPFIISYHDVTKRVEKIVEADSEEQMEHENLISTFEGASVGCRPFQSKLLHLF